MPDRRPHAVRIDLLLGSLVAFDLVLSLWGFLLPELWFRVWHGADYVDPQALLPRCAANWTAFLILQASALVAWRRAPWWLAVVAGVRLSDVFTDLTVSVMAESVPVHTRILFPLMGVGNLLLGLALLRLYHGQTVANAAAVVDAGARQEGPA